MAKKNAYPRQIVDHKTVRDRALSRYKAGLGRDNIVTGIQEEASPIVLMKSILKS
jgi:hypothetical protein